MRNCSHNKIGDVQRAQGNLPAALTSYQASLGIAERLAKADPGNAGWQRDLSVSHNKIRSASSNALPTNRRVEVAMTIWSAAANPCRRAARLGVLQSARITREGGKVCLPRGRRKAGRGSLPRQVSKSSRAGRPGAHH
jgi:hypothetical protein